MRCEASSNSVIGRADLRLRPRLRSAARSAGGSSSPGRAAERCPAGQHLVLQLRAESRRRGWPSSPRNNCTTDSGNAISTAGSSTASRVSPLVTIMMRHVADHLGGRRDLDDVAEHLVDLRVGAAPPRASDGRRCRASAPARADSCTGRPACRARRPRRRPRGCRSRTRHSRAAPVPNSRRSSAARSGSSSESRGPKRKRLDDRSQIGLRGEPGQWRRWRRRRRRRPPSTAASTLAAAIPLVSCVWK